MMKQEMKLEEMDEMMESLDVCNEEMKIGGGEEDDLDG